MRLIAALTLCAIILSTGCARRRIAGPPPPPNSGSTAGDSLLLRFFDTQSSNKARNLTMMAHLEGRLVDMKKSATIDARRTITEKGEIEYDVLKQDGDATVRKQILARFMNAEAESALKDHSGVSINTHNYRFRYRGPRTVEGNSVHVYEITPRAKDIGMFKGEIWLEADTALILKESGKFVKSPSVFLKDAEFSRTYEIREGMSIPSVVETRCVVRVYGIAEVDVRYSDVEWKRTSPLAASPREEPPSGVF